MKNQDSTWLRERRKELDALLDFSNAEIGSMGAPEIAALAYNCRLFEADSSWQALIFRSATREPDPQDLVRKREEILELQRDLRERLERILEATETKQETTITEVIGPIVFNSHPLKDRFLLTLKEDGSKKVDSLKEEKARLDLRFVDLVKVLGLTPGRFRKCLRRDCGRIFYQSSLKERIYCSMKCSGAQRQSRFQEKLVHRDVKEGNIIIEGEGVVDELKDKQSSTDGDS